MKPYILFLLGVMMALTASAQTLRGEISLSDPFIMADPVTHQYYMTGTGGGVWTSPDLEMWTGPQTVTDVDGEVWFGSRPQIWASEIHFVEGKYYYIATFTNSGIQVDDAGHPRRAVHVLSSTLPEGAYTIIPGSDATYVPAEKTTLDGTLFTDTDGTRYLIYCHEWIQNGNGTIEYIPLKPDMKGTVGAGVVMTRAHNATWNTSPVTDGPYLFRTQTGRLGMIWTSWHGGRYVQGVAYSNSGTLAGPWIHEALPITPDNYGHGMLFRTFEGQLLMSIHSHRTIDESKQQWERHPTLFLMDDSGDRLQTVMEYKRDIGPSNPTQVMVDNPEFEYGKQGWISTTGAQNQLIASNQSGAITGNFFESWDANSFTGEMYQERTVPNGTYQVSAAAFRSVIISGGRQDAQTIYLFANDEKVLVDNPTPQMYTVTVHVTNGRLRFGIRSEKKNFKWMGIDNVKVQYFGEAELTADDIDRATRNAGIYLRNGRNGMYLNAGQSWGTQAVLATHPLDFYLVSLSDGTYALDSRLNNGGSNHYASANGYLDGVVTPFTLDWVDDHTVTLTTDGTHYWGSSSGTQVSTTLVNATYRGVQWEVLTYDDLMAELCEATPSAPVDATFLIQCPNFGRNDTRIAAWQGSTITTGGDATNMCAQAPTGTFQIFQTLTSIPNGTYEVHMQGFGRSCTSQLFANEESVPLVDINSERGTKPTSLETASARFTAKKYKNELTVEVTNGQLTLGVRQTDTSENGTNEWTVFDNFELTYLGNTATAVNYVRDTPTAPTSLYDLQGRRVSTPSRRTIYLKDGKKIIY